MMKIRKSVIVIASLAILFTLLSYHAIAQLPLTVTIKTLKSIEVHHAIRHKDLHELAKGLKFQQLLDTITSKGLGVNIFHAQFNNGDSISKAWLNIYIMRVLQSVGDTAYFFAKSEWPGDTLFFSNEILKNDTLMVQMAKGNLYGYKEQFNIALDSVNALFIMSDRVDYYRGDPYRQNKHVNFQTGRVKRTFYGGSNACNCDHTVITSLLDDHRHYESFNSPRFIVSDKKGWDDDPMDLSFMISSKRSENSLHFKIKVFDDSKKFDKDISKSDHINLVFLYYPNSYFGKYDSSSYDEALIVSINPYSKKCEIKDRVIDSMNVQFEESDSGYVISFSTSFRTLKKHQVKISNRNNECLGFTCEVIDYDYNDSSPTIMATSNFREHPNCIGQLTFYDFIKDSWCPFKKLETNE